MNPKSKRITAVALSALLLTGAGVAMAGERYGHRHGCERDGARGPAAALSQLDGLTSDQQEQLKAIRADVKEAMRDLRDDMRDTRSELRSAMKDDADIDAIRALAQKQGEQKAELIVLRAETRKKISEVLTDDQRQQLTQLMDQRRGHGRHHDERDL